MNLKNYVVQIVFLIPFLFSLFIQMPTVAEGNNVADCFKEGVDCEEFSDIQANINQSNESEADIGEEDAAVESNEQQSVPSLFKSFVQMILALILVLGLIYLMLKLVNRRQQLFSQTQTLENIGGISVGQNKSIQVIRVGSKMYLVGVGDNVQLLKEIDDDQTKTNLSQKQVKEPMTFKAWIKSFFRIKAKQADQPEPNSFKNILTNELEQMKDNRQKMIQRLDKKDDTYE